MSESNETHKKQALPEYFLKLLPGHLVDDIEKRSRAGLILAILLLGSLAAIAMTLVRAIQIGWVPATWITLALAATFCLILASLKFAKRLEPISDALIFSCGLLILGIVFTDGGLTSRVLVWPPALVLLAAFIGDKFSAARTVLFMSSGMLLILILQLTQRLPVPWDQAAIIGRWIACTAAMLFVLLVGNQFKVARMRAEFEYQALESERRRWLAMVTHELRTPLTVIYGSLALLENENTKTVAEDRHKGMDELLSLSKKNTERLIRLVNNILDMERLQEGKFDFDMQTIDARQLVNEVCQFCAHLASAKQIRLNLSFEANPLLCVDHDKMTQVLINLISNAVKFSPSNSDIDIAVRHHHKDCEIRVRDYGPGIPEAFLPQLFSRFAQSKSTETRHSGGTGLGLHVSKLIVDAHHGELFVIRHQPGCEFVLRLSAIPPAHV